MSTSLGTLPNARHCHINDVVTAQQMTTKLLPAWIRGQGKAVPLQSEEIAFCGEYMRKARELMDNRVNTARGRGYLRFMTGSGLHYSVTKNFMGMHLRWPLSYL